MYSTRGMVTPVFRHHHPYRDPCRARDDLMKRRVVKLSNCEQVIARLFAKVVDTEIVIYYIIKSMHCQIGRTKRVVNYHLSTPPLY